MNKRTHFFTRLLLLFALLALAIPTLAQEPVTDDDVNEVAKDLFCPVCENTPLDVCPTQACADWRELIRTQLAEGNSKDEVHEYFARQYGDGVLADPPKRGFNLILWILPVAALILGGIFFARYLKTLRLAGHQAEPSAPITTQPITASTQDSGTPSPPTSKDKTAYRNQVEEELRNL